MEGLSTRLSGYGFALVAEGFRRLPSLLGVPEAVKAPTDQPGLRMKGQSEPSAAGVALGVTTKASMDEVVR